MCNCENQNRNNCCCGCRRINFCFPRINFCCGCRNNCWQNNCWDKKDDCKCDRKPELDHKNDCCCDRKQECWCDRKEENKCECGCGHQNEQHRPEHRENLKGHFYGNFEICNDDKKFEDGQNNGQNCNCGNMQPRDDMNNNQY